MARITSSFWGKIWRARAPLAEGAREEYLKDYNKKIDPSLIETPTIKDISAAIRTRKNTSPGPDGIPFAAWRSVEAIAGPVLLNVLHALANGDKPRRVTIRAYSSSPKKELP